MKRSDYKKNVIFIICLVIIIGVMSVGYAILSSTLSINFGTVTQTGLTFNVGFDTTTVNGTGTNNSICGSVHPTSNSVTDASPKLFYGSQCIYRLVVKNTGSTKASLTGITNVYPTLNTGSVSFTCTATTNGEFSCVNSNSNGGRINYKLCSDADCNNVLTIPTVINSNASKTVFLKISRDGWDDELVPDYYAYGGGFKVNFSAY